MMRVIDDLDRWTGLAATWRLAKTLVMLGSAIIFAAAALGSRMPQPWFGNSVEGIAADIIGCMVALLAIFAACRFVRSDSLSWAIAAAWLAACLAGAIGILASGPAVGSVVALAEAAVLAAACVTLARPLPPAILHYLLTAMLIVFGSVHLIWHDAISQLIPAFVPFRGAWPWVTGTLQLAAGFASLSTRLARIAYPSVAAVFLAWIPLVHLPRILSGPSVAEFSFAAMAVALAGALILAAGRPWRAIANGLS